MVWLVNGCWNHLRLWNWCDDLAVSQFLLIFSSRLAWVSGQSTHSSSFFSILFLSLLSLNLSVVFTLWTSHYSFWFPFHSQNLHSYTIYHFHNFLSSFLLSSLFYPSSLSSSVHPNSLSLGGGDLVMQGITTVTEQQQSANKRIRKPSLLYEGFEGPVMLPHASPNSGPPQPPVRDPSRQGRITNQLQFLQKVVVKYLWRHHFSWPFHEPVDATKLNLPVSAAPDTFHENLFMSGPSND